MQKFISKSKKLNKVLEEAREESYLQVLALGQKKGVPDFAGIGEIITMSDEPEKENWEEEFDRMILRGKFDIGEVKSLIRTQIAEAIQEGYNRGRVKCLEQHGLEEEIYLATGIKSKKHWSEKCLLNDIIWEIQSQIAEAEKRGYEKGLKAIKGYPMKVCFEDGKMKTLDVECREARQEEREKIIEEVEQAIMDTIDVSDLKVKQAIEQRSEERRVGKEGRC